MAHLKRSAADVACERLEAGVLATVGDQVGGLTERLTTDGTLVWLLACSREEGRRRERGFAGQRLGLGCK